MDKQENNSSKIVTICPTGFEIEGWVGVYGYITPKGNEIENPFYRFNFSKDEKSDLS